MDWSVNQVHQHHGAGPELISGQAGRHRRADSGAYRGEPGRSRGWAVRPWLSVGGSLRERAAVICSWKQQVAWEAQASSRSLALRHVCQE